MKSIKNNPTNQKDCSKTIYSGAILPGTKWEYKRELATSVGLQVHLKGGVTIKNLLVTPKDQDPMLKKSGVIYK